MKKKTEFYFSYFIILSLIVAYQPISLLAKVNQFSENYLSIDALKDTVEIMVEKAAYKEGINLVQQYKSKFENQQNWLEYTECTVLLTELISYQDITLMLENANQALKDIQTYQLKDELLKATAKHYKAIALSELNPKENVVEIFEESALILIQHEEWEKVIKQEYYLAIHYLVLKDFTRAKIHIKKGRHYGNLYNYKKFDTFLLNVLSVINYREGDYQKAIVSTLGIIENQEKISNPKDQDKIYLSRNYKNLGSFYSTKGELKRALACYYKINEIFENNEKNITKHFPKHFNNISKILHQKKEYRASIKTLRKSIAYKMATPKKNIKTYENLIRDYHIMASNWYYLENADSLLHFANLSLSIPTNYERHYTYFHLAQAYLKLGNNKKALTYLKESEKDFNLNQKIDKNYSALLNQKFCETYKAEKDYKNALLHIQKSLAINCSIFDDTTNLYQNPPLKNITFPTKFLESLQTKAQLLTKISPNEKDQKAALETYQLAIQWIDTLQNSYVLEGSQLFWSQTYKEIYSETIDLCYQFYQKTGEQQYLKLAFDVTEKSKALLLLEGLKEHEGKAISSLPDSLIQKEKDLKLDLAFYEKSLQTATQKEQTDRINLYQSYLANTRLNLGRLKEQMEVDYPDYYQLKYANTTISIPEIQDKIVEERSAFLAYFLGTEKSYAFVIGKDYNHFISLDSVSIIQQKTDTLFRQLKDPTAFQQNTKLAFQTYNQAAFDVYQAILAKVCQNLPESVNQLIIAPDDVLNDLPFETLTDQLIPQPSLNFGKLPYLLRKFEIYYTYSANLLWKNQDRQMKVPANIQCYALAPPYKVTKEIAAKWQRLAVRSGITQLEGTEQEIQSISKYFDGKYENNSDATKTNFMTNADQFGLLHLAMHGEANQATDAHLVFTNLGQDSTTDNLLYHYEISNMDLTAQLAVLSACETGVGKYVQGEGVFSLARSFMYAGVPSIAMSLWQVNDLSTSTLMPYFYENLANGSSKSKALHQAKLSFLDAAELENRHPYYWSSFVLLGDGSALKTSNSAIWWYLFAGVFFLVGGIFYKRMT